MTRCMRVSLAVYPVAAPSGSIRFWVGAFGRRQAPLPRFTLDGQAVQPAALRPMASVRAAKLLSGDPARVWSGLYELPVSGASQRHRLAVAEDGAAPCEREVRPLPAALPHGDSEGFNVLLCSCFCHDEALPAFSRVVSDVVRSGPLDLTLLMGDQVYLDLPTLENFPTSPADLAAKFEGKYVANWDAASSFAQILGAAPSVAIPDDHEYWNNAPNTSPFIQNSWTADGRQSWRLAADATFAGFQSPVAARGLPVELDVPPLSFFVADTRTDRKPDLSALMSEAAHQRLAAWVDRLNARKLIGVFVTGQSMFSQPISRPKGAIADWELANYADYGRMVRHLARTENELLCVTGDVHWGRVVCAHDSQPPPGSHRRIWEVIASPSALVTTVGSDQARRLLSGVRSLFGRRDPWPRHDGAPHPPDFFAGGVMRGRFASQKIAEHRGDHVAVLSFRWLSQKLEAFVSYWPIHDRLRAPSRVPLFTVPCAHPRSSA